MEQIQTMYSNYLLYVEQGESNSLKYLCCAVPILVQSGHGHRQRLAVVRVVIGGYYNIIIDNVNIPREEERNPSFAVPRRSSLHTAEVSLCQRTALTTTNF